MKETITIYVCECGREFDNSFSAACHGMQCRQQWDTSCELTTLEYENWQVSRKGAIKIKGDQCSA